MIGMRCRGLLSSIVVSSVVLVGCGTGDTDSDSFFSDLSIAGDSDEPATALEHALTLVDSTDDSYIAFADQSRINELAYPEWFLLSSVASPIADYPADELGIDLQAAELLITVGDSSLIHGGQNTSDITEAAETEGWSDRDGVLRQAPVSTQPLTIPAPSLLPFNESVAYGASVGIFQPTEHTLNDVPRPQSLSLCLGDVISAVLMGGVAVGVTEEGGVICSMADGERPGELAERISSNLTAGETLSGQPWSSYVRDVEAGSAENEARVTFTRTRSTDPTFMMTALRSGEYRNGFTGVR